MLAKQLKELIKNVDDNAEVFIDTGEGYWDLHKVVSNEDCLILLSADVPEDRYKEQVQSVKENTLDKGLSALKELLLHKKV